MLKERASSLKLSPPLYMRAIAHACPPVNTEKMECNVIITKLDNEILLSCKLKFFSCSKFKTLILFSTDFLQCFKGYMLVIIWINNLLNPHRQTLSFFIYIFILFKDRVCM